MLDLVHSSPIASITSSAYWPFAVLLLGIALIIALIGKLRVHPFIALIAAAFLVGALSHSLPGEGNHFLKAINLPMTEMGTTAGKIAWVIALASVIGICLMESGAADRIVRTVVRALGVEKAGWALMLSSFFLSIPVFFDTVFFLLIPLAQALAFRVGKHYLFFIMAMCAGGVITHGLVPPTPGPLVMIDTLQLDLGFAMIVGVALGLPAGAFGLFVSRKLDTRVIIEQATNREELVEELSFIVNKEDSELPSFMLSILPVLLPVLLITGASSIALVADSVSPAVLGVVEFFGDKNIAMALGTAISLYLLISQQNLKSAELWKRMEGPIATAGTIILITSAGGAFGAMIRHAGVGDAIKTLVEGSGFSLILLAWIIAAVMKVAQGSATVSMITAAGIMASITGLGGVESGGLEMPYHPVYLFTAIAAGATFGSWMNDSGFWIVCKLSGLTEGQTLRTWTVLLSSISLFILLETLIFSFILPLL